MDTIPGYHTTYLYCRACGHEVSGVLEQNALVGKTHRLVCSKCSARDVAVSMSWCWGGPPPASPWPPLPGRAGPQ